MNTNLAKARGVRAAQAQRWSKQLAGFEHWRPTPTPAEHAAMAAGDLPLSKEWDRSPVDASAFDPGQAAERPTAPTVTVAGLAEVGRELTAKPAGDWSRPTSF